MHTTRRKEFMRGLRQAIKHRLCMKQMSIGHVAAFASIPKRELKDLLSTPLSDLTINNETLRKLRKLKIEGAEFWDRHTIRLLEHVGGFHEKYR